MYALQEINAPCMPQVWRLYLVSKQTTNPPDEQCNIHERLKACPYWLVLALKNRKINNPPRWFPRWLLQGHGRLLDERGYAAQASATYLPSRYRPRTCLLILSSCLSLVLLSSKSEAERNI